MAYRQSTGAAREAGIGIVTRMCAHIGQQRNGTVMARIAVKSEITGTVWKIEVSPGTAVANGDTLIVIESMKMEIPVLAETSGTVREILVSEQQPVAEGQDVVILDT